MVSALRQHLLQLALLSVCHAAGIGIQGQSFSQEMQHPRQLLQDMPTPMGLILNGKGVRCGRFPYMVSLRAPSNLHRCGGVLVHPRWVVTAAHCVDPRDENSLGATPRVVIGACNLDDTINENGAVEVTVAKKTVLYEGWTGDIGGGHDIALIKLSIRSKHTPASLPAVGHSPRPGDPLVALGWGLGSGDFLEQADTLEVVANDVCAAEDTWGNIITDAMVCAFSTEGQDVCSGDSGGPLLEVFSPGGDPSAGKPNLDIVVGVTSFGEESDDCSSRKLPSVFTRLSSYSLWMEAVIKGRPLPPPITPRPSQRPQTLPSTSTSTSTSSSTSTSASKTNSTSTSTSTSASKTNSTSTSTTPPGNDALDMELFHLASSEGGDDMEAAAEDLLSRGANPNACCYKVDRSNGCAVIHAAIAANNTAVASALLGAGADTEAACDERKTPLHWTANYHATDIASILVEKGANLESRTNVRNTPLHESALRNAMGVAAVLIAAGSDVDAKRALGFRPLHIVAVNDHLEIASMLLEARADVNAASDSGLTPLHFAAQHLHVDMAKLLVDNGADVSAADEDEMTPRDYICSEIVLCDSIERARLEEILK